MNLKEYNKTVDEYADGIFRFIIKNIKNEEKARDIVQDTYEKLWINKQKVSPKKVKSYLFTTAYHTMIDLIRKEKRMTDFEGINENKYSHSQQYTDLGEILDQALQTLSEKQRSIILLRDYEGYSYKEIGEILKLNESQVKVYIFRARVLLKKYIGHLETVL